jgi:hypothetical protein
METPDPLDSFHAALEERHLSELAFKEVRHALQALSSLYVERRSVEKLVNSIFRKLDLGESEDVSKRVKAALIFLAESEATSSR